VAAGVLVLAEPREHALDSVTWELLALGRRLADRLETSLDVIILGDDVSELVETLAESGVDRVLPVASPRLLEYNPEIYSRVISDLLKARAPEYFIIGHTCLGIEMGPSVAARTGATLVTDCLELEMPDGHAVVTRPTYGGTVHTRLEVSGPAPYILSFQKGSLEKTPLPPRRAEVTPVPLAAGGWELLSRVIGRREPPKGEVDLTTAEIIVSIGRGIGGQENVALGVDLAAALGAGLGCSRHLADQGWLPPHCHVGMEGQTVAPRVYLAFGISGAAHHVGGIRDSDLIIAINKEPNAPIFTVADYGVVADLFEIMPALTEAARQRATGS